MRTSFLLLALACLLCCSASESFEEEQLRFSKVKEARDDKESKLRQLFKEKGINYPAAQVFLRAFKQEKELEIWIRPKTGSTWQLLKIYDICALSGRLGPKRREGDGQVPEGFYRINHFNPESSYYLSLGINYPNASDKILSDKSKPGGAIYIHGKCVTIGCMPMTDEGIKEIYWLCVKAKAAGQSSIQVHVFPGRFTLENKKWWKEDYTADKKLLGFWDNLEQGYSYFEKKKLLPQVSVDEKGKYLFK
jgi:murein L,D-transpeptidase YafK